MDVRQLSALLAVADHGTFSAAADALHTVQSNVSSHVAQLEKELDAQLIDRSQGRLTEEGVAVATRARRILNELSAARADVAALKNMVIGEVKFGVIGTAGPWLVPRILETMSSRYPLAQLQIHEAVTSQLEPQLLNGQLDLALMVLPASSADLTTQVLFEEEVLLVVPRTHPLADNTRISITRLRDVPLLLPPANTPGRVMFDALAARAGSELTAKAEVDGVRLTAALTFDGLGPAILPASSLPSGMSNDWRLVRVNEIPPRQVGLARARRTYPNSAARALREVVSEAVTVSSQLTNGLTPVIGRWS